MGMEHVRRDGRILIIRRYRPERVCFRIFPQTGWKRCWTRAGFYLADVREPEEYREGHLAGAVNLPVQQILKNNRTIWFF